MPVTFDRVDLDFILRQIEMAEAGQPPVSPHLAFWAQAIRGDEQQYANRPWRTDEHLRRRRSGDAAVRTRRSDLHGAVHSRHPVCLDPEPRTIRT